MMARDQGAGELPLGLDDRPPVVLQRPPVGLGRPELLPLAKLTSVGLPAGTADGAAEIVGGTAAAGGGSFEGLVVGAGPQATQATHARSK